MRFLSILALAAPLASAIKFTSPSAGSTLQKGKSFDLTWESVDTDPAAFSLFLVNFVYWPPFYGYLDGVTTSDGRHSVTMPCNIDAQDGYQINAINGTNVYVIYAQTPKFAVGGSTCSSPTIDKNSNNCAPGGTVTVTSTATETVRVSRTTSTTSQPTSSTLSTTTTATASTASTLTSSSSSSDTSASSSSTKTSSDTSATSSSTKNSGDTSSSSSSTETSSSAYTSTYTGTTTDSLTSTTSTGRDITTSTSTATGTGTGTGTTSATSTGRDTTTSTKSSSPYPSKCRPLKDEL